LRVLVTGAGGFIGSHVVEELLAHGHAVRAFVRYNSRSSTGNLELVAAPARAAVEIFFGNVEDSGSVEQALEGVDAVLHLAALIGIPYSYAAPRSYYATNVLGTLNVLEAARRLDLSRVVVTSTSEVYGTALYTPIDEAHPLQGQSPYSASKIAADKLTESYFRSFDLPTVVLRPFNTYGPRQSARAVIPTVLSQLLAGRRRLELGSLAPQRDFVFVKDTARAFRLALETPGIEGETIHFGTGEAVSIGELVELCIRVSGAEAEVVERAERVRPERSEVGLLLAGSAKAEEKLGWRPTTSLVDGLAEVKAFLERHLGHYEEDRYAV
jgi:dTDP-glucose 4,6-dehydratase